MRQHQPIPGGDQPECSLHACEAASDLAADSSNDPSMVDHYRELRARLSATHAELEAAEQRYRLLVERLPAIIYVCESSARSATTYVSPRISDILGYQPEDWLKDPEFWIQHVHPEDRLTALQEDEQCRLSGAPLRSEYRMLARDGRSIWVRDEAVLVTDSTGRQLLQGVLYDITATRKAQEDLLANALRDTLTGLPNRGLLLDRLSRAMACRRRDPSRQFAVLSIDLDRFKMVNDSIGHHAGDQMLIEFAQRLKMTLRPGDTVARLGGDEFAVLLEEIHNLEHVSGIVDRIQSALKRPFQLQDHEVFSSSSIGIAMSAVEYHRPQDMLRDAELAMYKVKSDGKAGSRLFDSAMHSQAVKLLTLESDLRRAVERREFVVFYQPIIQLATGEIESVEALVRWQHPSKGFVSPADFIPVAEETGLITDIGRLVLEAACRQTAIWNARPGASPISASVNLSPRQFRQHGLVSETLGILDTAGLHPRHLKLEITETAIMESQDTASKMLSELKQHQIQVAIDDFGTGYSSLGQLQRFPIDIVKMDRCFVQKLNSRENTEIVRTIVQLAHTLGMCVTAEGVETEAQLKTICALNCQSAQGYYFAKPVSAADFTQLLETRGTWMPLRAAV